MTLYLGIFEGDEERDGWVFGHYSDFAYFRDTIAETLSNAMDRFPQLMQHSDCDGEWTGDSLRDLKSEVATIAKAFRAQQVHEPQGAFEHTAEFRRGGRTLYDCFHNVDGENIFEALLTLCDNALSSGHPIVLQ